MFREIRRFKQQISEEECKRVLREEKRAVFSVNGDDGYPFSIPINYVYDEEENKIYFHGAKAGHKVDSIKKSDKVCFTVWDQGTKAEGKWYYTVTSVVIFGRAVLVEDPVLTEKKVRKFGQKYMPTKEMVEQEIIDSLKNTQLYEIDIEHMTGKLVKER